MKPAYSIPSLASLVVPPDAPTVVSTFSGMGGSCLGFKMAGFRHVLACEFIEEARKTYARNFPGVQLAGENVRELTPEEILRRTGLRKGELDVFEGSPPCSSFSTAGKGAKGWGKEKKYSDSVERTDDLFWEYIRLLRGLQPRAFVAENVSGMVKGASKGIFLEVLRELKASGYKVRAQLLDAQWLGVPQARQRVIFVGAREDLGVEPAFPSPLPYRYTIRDACPWIDRVVQRNVFREGDRVTTSGEPCPAITNKGIGGKVKEEVHVVAREPTDAECAEASIERFAIGVEWEKTPVGSASKRYFNLVKPDPDKPCPTITQTGGNLGAASVVHPYEKRKFTIAEIKLLSGIPSDFVLTGKFQQQWERVGRCVPPIMMMHVARAVKAMLARAR